LITSGTECGRVLIGLYVAGEQNNGDAFVVIGGVFECPLYFSDRVGTKGV
jgi:hypothetical protein